MAYKMYRLLADSKISPEVKTGAVVYDILGYDYGLARDDTMMTGVPHVSVTTDENGGYPSFTIPKADLEEIGDAPFYTAMIAARKGAA